MSELREGLVDPGTLGRITPSTIWDWPTNWPQTTERRCSANECSDGGRTCCDSALVWWWSVLPAAWQMQLWGKVLDTSGYWLCPNVWATHKMACLGIEHQNYDPEGRDARVAAEAMWEGALQERRERIAARPESVDFSTARCASCGGGCMLYLGRYMHACPLEPVTGPSGVAEVPAREAATGSLAVANGAWGAGGLFNESASPSEIPALAVEEEVHGEDPGFPREMTWEEIVHGREGYTGPAARNLR